MSEHAGGERLLPTRGDWQFLGRDEELVLLAHYVEHGHGGVLLAGEPGVGKSRVALELLGRSAAAGHRSAIVRATRSSAGIPFGAFAEHLPDGISAVSSRVEVLRAIARQLAALPGTGRLFLGVDDAHLLDESSAALVHHLASGGDVFVVLTVRNGTRAPDAIDSLWKDGLVERIELQTLADAEVAALAAAALGGPVDGMTARRLVQWSAGNPLYLREVVLAGLARGALREEAGVWSWNGPALAGRDVRLLELIRARLDGLDDVAAEVVDLVALGEPLELDVLRGCTDARAVDEAERQGVVVVDDGERPTARLGHPLYGEAVRATMPRGRAAELSQRLGRALRAAPWRREADDLRLATWCLQAGPNADDVDLLVRAARRAIAVSDCGLAAQMAHQARLVGGGVAARLTEAEALYWEERFVECVEVLDALEPEADDDDIAQAAILAGSALFWGAGQVAPAEARLHAAVDRLPDGGPREEVVAHLASLAFFNARVREGIDLAMGVLASPASTPDARLRALSPLAAGWAVAGQRSAAIGAADIGLPYGLERAEELPQVAGALVLGRCLALLVAGDLDEAEEMSLLTREVLLSEGAIEFLGTWSLFLGRIALERGVASDAVEHLRTAVTELRQHDPGGLLAWAWGLLGHAHVLAGDRDAARAALDECRRVATEAVRVFEPEVLRAEAAYHLAAGERSLARELLERSIDVARASGARVAEGAAWHALARLGRAPAAVEALRELVVDVEGALLNARLREAEGLAADDGAALDDAAARFASLGCWAAGAAAAQAAATAHQRAGRRGSRLASIAVAQDLGGRCGLPMGTTGAAPDDDLGLSTLTDREREVVHLAASGLTNRQIAERLYLSVRTVNNHLNHAYAKLGLSDREQLASLIGLAPPPSASG